MSDTKDSEAIRVMEALREDVIARGIKMSGPETQSRADGVPVFEDGRVALFTFRAWGDFVAAVWNTGGPDRDTGYWAWSL